MVAHLTPGKEVQLRSLVLSNPFQNLKHGKANNTKRSRFEESVYGHVIYFQVLFASQLFLSLEIRNYELVIFFNQEHFQRRPKETKPFILYGGRINLDNRQFRMIISG